MTNDLIKNLDLKNFDASDLDAIFGIAPEPEPTPLPTPPTPTTTIQPADSTNPDPIHANLQNLLAAFAAPVQTAHPHTTYTTHSPAHYRIRYKGQSLTMHEFSALIGVPYHCARRRLLRGWSIDRIANTPARTYVKKNKCE